MTLPLGCPVCGSLLLEPTLQHIELTVNHGSNVGGVMAYSCTHSNHIFFIRSSDLQQSWSTEEKLDASAP